MSPIEEPTKFEGGLSFFNELAKGSSTESFHEMTGSVGDVILLHPLMLHSASRNGRRLPRIITNPPVALVEPFKFNRENEKDYSLVELKTIQEIGQQAKTWKLEGQRAPVIPERVRRQAKMLEEERKRLQSKVAV